MIETAKLLIDKHRARLAEAAHLRSIKYMSMPVGEQIFTDMFELLSEWVRRGGLDLTDFIGQDGINAEFEINQLYVWYRDVFPRLITEITNADEAEALYETEQKQLKRLIEIRSWLQ